MELFAMHDRAHRGRGYRNLADGGPRSRSALPRTPGVGRHELRCPRGDREGGVRRDQEDYPAAYQARRRPDRSRVVYARVAPAVGRLCDGPDAPLAELTPGGPRLPRLHGAAVLTSRPRRGGGGGFHTPSSST